MKPQTKAALGLIGFFVFYILFINIYNTADLHSDEARHASQGIVMAEYLKSLGSEGYQPYRSFVDDHFTALYPQAGFAALYDPPLHAFLQSLSFLLLGTNIALVRLSAQAIILLFAVFAYLVSYQVLRHRGYAVLSTILFFLMPYSFTLSRENMLSIPVALLTCGWYYFTFLRTPDLDSKELLVRMIGGGLCLSGAALMMYQTLVYIPLFMVVYTLIELYQKRGSFFQNFGQSTVFLMLVQSGICAVLMLAWFSVSFIDSIIPQLLIRAGTQEVKGGAVGTLEYLFSFGTQLVTESLFLVLFAFVAFADRRFVKRHWTLILFVAVTLISATLVLSNRQLRYIAHLMPFVAILMVQGGRIIKTSLHKTDRWVYGCLVLVFILLCAYNLQGAKNYSEEQGVYTVAYEWLRQQPTPRTLISLEIAVPREPYPYMHTSDTVLYNLINIHEPGQTGTYLKVDSVRSLAVAIDQVKQGNLFIIVYDPMLDTTTGKEIYQFFVDNGFKPTKIEPYTIFAHSTLRPEEIRFTSITKSKRALELINEGQRFFEQGFFTKAAIELEQALELEPLHLKLRIGLATTYASLAKDLIDHGDTDKARVAMNRAVAIYPWILEELVGTDVGNSLSALVSKPSPQPVSFSNATSTA